ncbi:DUF481 domain-containing protein [Rubellicoccus peritrichatus]|uniref:DUF481 domain-containing protein n=1 Tax=Rubellicoccus peritrichatus TaxID=3080537 RepID=A0AAQ3LAS4_9BACT|nr:DUF481 domain-containing protein [Puniceicoccus sp. CR14]WOO42261.1 DUF481 domain-containing protein [Puniceicoccus sp. CR14]
MLLAKLRNPLTAVFTLLLVLLANAIKATGPEVDFGATTTPVAPMPSWKPSPEIADDDDWIELTSGEWLKGEIKYMYDEELVFDSDKLGDLSIDWDDIKQIKSPRKMSFRLNNRTTVTGHVHMEENGELEIKGVDGEILADDVVSMVPEEKGRFKNWTISISIGADFQTGNTDETSYSASAKFNRRTALTRFNLSYLGNYSKNDGQVTTSNQRANSYFDYFVDKRLFIRPIFAEYYRDRFQNINFQGTLGSGIGYQLYKSSNVEWDIVAGPAYQVTRFDTVVAGSKKTVQTPAGLFVTTVNYDITDDLTYDGNYQIIFTSKNSGLISNHFVSTLSYEINDLFDINTSLIWDRVQNPTEKADGTFPKKDDFNLIFGLGFSY